MAIIYEDPDGMGQMLFTKGTNILLCKKQGRTFSKTTTLCENYFHSFSSFYWKNTIYYCYIATNFSLIFRELHTNEPLLMLPRKDHQHYLSPLITAIDENLLFIYICFHESDQNYTLHTQFPYYSTTTLSNEYANTCQKEQKALQSQLLALQEELSHTKQQLSNASIQYNDLMQVATQYKAEAKRWHDQLFRRKDY